MFSMDSRQAWILLRLKKYPKNWHSLVAKQFARQKPLLMRQITVLRKKLDTASSVAVKAQLNKRIAAVKKKIRDFKFRMKEDPGCLAGGVAYRIMRKKEYASLKPTGAGLPISGHRKMIFYNKEMARTFGLGFLFSIIFMLLMMRDVRSFFGAIIMMISANVILFGSMGWLKIPVDPSMRVVPMMLILAASVGYTIHVLNFFKRFLRKTGQRKESVGGGAPGDRLAHNIYGFYDRRRFDEFSVYSDQGGQLDGGEYGCRCGYRLFPCPVFYSGHALLREERKEACGCGQREHRKIRETPLRFRGLGALQRALVRGRIFPAVYFSLFRIDKNSCGYQTGTDNR